MTRGAYRYKLISDGHRKKVASPLEVTGKSGCELNGCTSITYNPSLKKYLFCITDGSAAWGPYDTNILESASITGPWELVVFMKSFGDQGYFVNIPSRFISKDGRTAWICYSANFSVKEHPALRPNPPGSRYGMNLQEIRLRAKR